MSEHPWAETLPWWGGVRRGVRRHGVSGPVVDTSARPGRVRLSFLVEIIRPVKLDTCNIQRGT